MERCVGVALAFLLGSATQLSTTGLVGRTALAEAVDPGSEFIAPAGLDLFGPAVTVVAVDPADATTGLGGAFAVTWSASDGTTGSSDVTSGEFSVDGGTTWSPGIPLTGWGQVELEFSTGTLVAPFDAGVVQVCARAFDADGNASDPACRAVTVLDDLAPTLAVSAVSPMNATPFPGWPYSVTWSASDGTTGGSDITSGAFTLDGGATWSPAVPLTAWGAVELSFSTGTRTAPYGAGPISVCARVTDASGNTSDESCQTVTVPDVNPPSVYFTVRPENRVPYGDAVPFVIRAMDGLSGSVSTGQFRIDGGPWTEGIPLTGWGTPTVDFSVGTWIPAAGYHVVSVRAKDASGNWTPVPTTYIFEVTRATTTTLFTGDTFDGITDGTTYLAARLDASAGQCLDAGTIGFRVLDRTSGTEEVEVTSGSLAFSGAGASPEHWIRLAVTDGTFLVRTEFTPTDPSCSGSSDESVLTVLGATGDYLATGGGWYRVGTRASAYGTNSRIDFGLTVRKVAAGRTPAYRGQVLWVNRGAFRLQATILTTGDGVALGTFKCPAGYGPGYRCGAINGVGTLQKWTGRWVTATDYSTGGIPGRVAFTALLMDGGSVTTCNGNGKFRACSTKDQPDYFGIQIEPVPWAVIRESDPVELGGGTGKGSLRVY